MPISTMQIKLTSGRIKEAKVHPDGICELLIEVTENERKPRISDSDLILIDAESLSMKDEFLKHKTKNDEEKDTKELILEAIKKGVKNFWKPKGDISYTADWKGVCYAPGKMPAVGKSYDWHEKAAKEFCTERNSRLGSRIEYGAFLGVLMKKLIEEGKTVEWVWNAVCNDSRELGHYWNSENPKHDFEPTGSREICGLCDLANAYKILVWDNAAGGFWLAGGCCDDRSDHCPLAVLCLDSGRGYDRDYGVGWLVLS